MLFETEADIEALIRTKAWVPFQTICERLFIKLYPDFSPVWFWWIHGDLKNDGYCFSNWIFIQCYATAKDTNSPNVPEITKKINEDFTGCVKEWWDDVKEFYFITNNTLHADNLASIQLLRKAYPHIKILTWEQKRLASVIWETSNNSAISNILGVTFNGPFGIVTIDIIDTLVSSIFNNITSYEKIYNLGDKDEGKLVKLERKIWLNFPDEYEKNSINKLMTNLFIDTILKIEEYIENTNDGKLKSNAIIDRITDEFKILKGTRNPNTEISQESLIKSIARNILTNDEQRENYNFYQCAIGLVLYVFERCDIWLTE